MHVSLYPILESLAISGLLWFLSYMAFKTSRNASSKSERNFLRIWGVCLLGAGALHRFGVYLIAVLGLAESMLNAGKNPTAFMLFLLTLTAIALVMKLICMWSESKSA